MQARKTTFLIFSDNLQNAMDQNNLHQAGLASKVGVTQASVSKWLNGSIPRGDQLHLVSSALGVSMEWLLTGESGTEKVSGIPVTSKAAVRKALKDARAALERLEKELDSGS